MSQTLVRMHSVAMEPEFLKRISWTPTGMRPGTPVVIKDVWLDNNCTREGVL
ncbi:hypothetical protein PILCRDRAFT_825918 [Piloderma croceum F 1598]|uniref:Uncharacterized protein n=1 Tax=Piloderma croceum (strain F 1598) TaxID=765440 RepID=A0A0C3FAH3_PILCF|nr:hypothetical protein PILCRDRAFT_825918 [Piloderma croceum F 1598]